MIWLWAALTIAAVIIEAASAQLVSIWFALGGAAAFIAALCNAGVKLQVALFVGVSLILLIATFPLVRRFNKKNVTERTNADRYIGKSAIVIEDISNIDAMGQVRVDNQVWSARSSASNNIPKGTRVRVEKIEGVKLIVSPEQEIS